MESELLDIYRYIKFCLYSSQGISLKRMRIQRDVQHDVFLYVVDEKKFTSLTPVAKRYIYLCAKYCWNGVSRNKYKIDKEIILLDKEGLQIEPGISHEVNADIAMDISLFAERKKIKNKKKHISNVPILVRYLNGKSRVYSSIISFIDDVGCSEFSAYKWLRDGKPVSRATTWHSGKNKDKYGHIKSIEYKMIKNPFNGSKTAVKKQLSEKSWKSRKDKSDFEMEDENEYCKLFIHKESGEGWIVKIRVPKGSEYYIKNLEKKKK